MKITKSIEVFDCEQFKVGRIYYISGWADDYNYEGLFLCEHSFSNTNAVDLKKIFNLQRACPSELRIDNNNFAIIDVVSEVDFKCEYDSTINEWDVYASIAMEEGCY